MGRLQGKVAIVSGGAMGIGRATATMFAEEGASVVLGDIDEGEGARVVEEIRGAGGVATFMKLDVADEDDWRRVVADTVDALRQAQCAGQQRRHLPGPRRRGDHARTSGIT